MEEQVEKFGSNRKQKRLNNKRQRGQVKNYLKGNRPEDFKETIKVINGKKYKAIKEAKKPTPLYEAKEEIRKMWDRIK